jgi:hypothetical protein
VAKEPTDTRFLTGGDHDHEHHDDHHDDRQDHANDKGNPPGKLADAELHFADGPLAGLKLIGFAIWERRTGGGRNATFPARQYTVNGERRSFALLRPIADATGQECVRDLVLEAYAEYEERAGKYRVWVGGAITPSTRFPNAGTVQKLTSTRSGRVRETTQARRRRWTIRWP